jgi:CMP-N,N'-diacetyllegionaminic acid synthase
VTTIATICARGGSKGVPRKNVRDLLGKPLIAYTVEQACAAPVVDRVFVSTDDEEIAEVAANAGAEVPFIRPAELASDTAPKIPVIRHLVDHIKRQGIPVTRIIDLDPTSPLREQSDIEACVNLLDEDTDVVITAYPADKNPYFNMVQALAGSGYDVVAKTDNPLDRRQDAPTVYSMNASIYVWWERTLGKGLFGPRTRLHVMPHERSVDIDDEIGFALVELLMRRKLTT